MVDLPASWPGFDSINDLLSSDSMIDLPITWPELSTTMVLSLPLAIHRESKPSQVIFEDNRVSVRYPFVHTKPFLQLLWTKCHRGDIILSFYYKFVRSSIFDYYFQSRSLTALTSLSLSTFGKDENNVNGNAVIARMWNCIHEIILNFGRGFPRTSSCLYSGFRPFYCLDDHTPLFGCGWFSWLVWLVMILCRCTA